MKNYKCSNFSHNINIFLYFLSNISSLGELKISHIHVLICFMKYTSIIYNTFWLWSCNRTMKCNRFWRHTCIQITLQLSWEVLWNPSLLAGGRWKHMFSQRKAHTHIHTNTLPKGFCQQEVPFLAPFNQRYVWPLILARCPNHAIRLCSLISICACYNPGLNDWDIIEYGVFSSSR